MSSSTNPPPPSSPPVVDGTPSLTPHPHHPPHAHGAPPASVMLERYDNDHSCTRRLPFGSCVVDIFGGKRDSTPPIPIEYQLGYDNSIHSTGRPTLILCRIRTPLPSSSSTTSHPSKSDNKSPPTNNDDTKATSIWYSPWCSSILEHSALCPPRYLHTRSSSGYVPREGAVIRFAVCVIVQCPQRGYLITKRSSKLRAFPGAWVFPGKTIIISIILISLQHLRNRWSC